MNYKEFWQLFGGAFFVFINRVIGAGAVFGTQILLARWMGATEVGIYVYAFSLCNLLAIFAGLGLGSSAIRFVGEGLAHKNYGSIMGLASIGGKIVFLSGLCFAFFGELAIDLTNGIISPQYIRALTFAMVGIPAMCLMNWQSCVAQCLNWFAAAFMPSNVSRPLLLIGAIALAHEMGQKLDAANVMLMHLVIMGLLWAGSAVYLSRRLSRRFADAKPTYKTGLWVSTGIPLLFVTLFTNFFLDINIVAVGIYLNPEQLAIFNASFRVAVLIGFGIQSIDAILLPRFSHLYAAQDFEKLKRIIGITTQLKFWSSFCGVVLFLIWGREILAYFGKEFVGGYNALLLLALSQLVRASVGPVSQMLSLTGHHAYCLTVSVMSTLTMLLLNFFLIKLQHFGILGAAYTVLVVIILESTLLSIASVKRLGINASVLWFFKFDDVFKRIL